MSPFCGNHKLKKKIQQENCIAGETKCEKCNIFSSCDFAVFY